MKTGLKKLMTGAWWLPSGEHAVAHNILVVLLIPVTALVIIVYAAVMGSWGALFGPYYQPMGPYDPLAAGQRIAANRRKH